MTTTKTLAALAAILALTACGGRGQKKSVETAASESRSEHDNGRSGNSNNGYPDGYFDTIPVLLDTRLTKDFERFDREFYDRYYDERFKRVVKTLADGTELDMSIYGGAPLFSTCGLPVPTSLSSSNSIGETGIYTSKACNGISERESGMSSTWTETLWGRPIMTRPTHSPGRMCWSFVIKHRKVGGGYSSASICRCAATRHSF